MHIYAAEVLDPRLRGRASIDFAAESALQEAIREGVAVLEMRFDNRRAAYGSAGLAGVARQIGGLVARGGDPADRRAA